MTPATTPATSDQPERLMAMLKRQADAWDSLGDWFDRHGPKFAALECRRNASEVRRALLVESKP